MELGFNTTPKGDQPSKSLIQSILIGELQCSLYSVSKINTYISVYHYSTCVFSFHIM